MLKWLALLLSGLLVLLALALGWLLGSEAGARFALARAVAASDGRLGITGSHGRLAGPLTLAGLSWRDPQAGIEARLREVRVDLRALALLRARVQVTSLQASGIELVLHSVPTGAAPAPAAPTQPFPLAPPLDLVLDRASLHDARIERDGAPLFAFDQLDLGAAWTSAGITLHSLALRAPAGTLDAHGALTNRAGHPGTAAVAFHWQHAHASYAGTLDLRGDGQRATLALALASPMRATLQATLEQTATLPWRVQLDLPRFDPALLQPDSALDAFALALDGSGDRHGGTFSGSATLNQHVLQLDPLRYVLDGHTLRLAPLRLKSAAAGGVVEASGSIALDAQPPSAALTLDWREVEIPAEFAGQRLASHGRLEFAGSAQAYHAQGTLALGPPGRLADIDLSLDGTPTTITLQRLALEQARGGLEARATLQLEPPLQWTLDANARRFDPGALVAAWPGQLDFTLTSTGQLGRDGPQATLKLDPLGGTLRGKPVRGRADLRLQPPWRIDGTLDLGAGSSRLELAGSGGAHNDARLRLAIGSLADWWPDASGRLDGDFRIRGQWPALAVEGRAHAAGIAHGTLQLDRLDLDADVTRVDPPQGTLTLKARKLAAGSLQLDHLELHGNGERSRHTLELVAQGHPLSLNLNLDGSVDAANDWRGNLQRLDLAIGQAPQLVLQQPVAFGVGHGGFTLPQLCLAASPTRLCAAASGSADGSLQASWQLSELPLALLAGLAGELPFQLDGVLAGSGAIQRGSNGALHGTLELGSARGAISAREDPDAPALAYQDLAVSATLAPAQSQARVHAGLGQAGSLDGTLTLDGAPGDTPQLDGSIDLSLDSLAFVEALTPQLAATRGRLDAHYRIDGSTAAPEFSGAVTLSDFASEVPAAGLKLHAGQLSLRASDAEHFVLDGSLKSGDGTLTLRGSGGSAPGAALALTIEGENFLAADIPAARVVVSPALRVERNQSDLVVGGSVTIPHAAINLARLPGGGASQSSPDVVIVDAEPVAAGKPLPLRVDVAVKLGDDVKLSGLGLDGRVSGQLSISQHGARAAVGTGTLNAQGTYRAYGQNLQIESGRVLFAGTALDNPGLDIRAVRTIPTTARSALDGGITAGLQVRGTARAPVLTVFSRPAMEQSEALSYLLTGKPLSGLKSGEGDMLGAAARALGSATGDLLAKGIGARLGVDAGVTDDAALGGAAFTVGRYLSPKLYLSYGVGLFTPGEVVSLKYFLGRRWTIEAQNATTGSRAGINYRHER